MAAADNEVWSRSPDNSVSVRFRIIDSADPTRLNVAALKHHLHLFSIAALDTLVNLLARRRSENQQAVVVRTDAIGDFAIWATTAHQLHTVLQSARVTLVVGAACADLAKRLPFWSEVIVVDLPRYDRDPAYRVRMSLSLRRVRYDVLLHPTYSRAFSADLLVRNIAAKTKIGFVGSLSARASANRLFDRIYSELILPKAPPVHELERAREFYDHLDAGPDPHRSTEETAPRLLPRLTKLKALGRPYFILFPGASHVGRRWPLDRFAEVGCWAATKYALTPVVAGGPADIADAAMLADKMDARVVNMAGQTSVPELVEWIREAEFVVTNETSAAHIAVAVGTAVVTILGGGHFGRFMPYPLQTEAPSTPAYVKMDCYNCNWDCPYRKAESDPFPCVDKVSCAQVKILIQQAG